MKKDGKYRFSLQFPAGSDEQVRAGELLERAGNRKSAVVVAALNEYLAEHPSLLAPDHRLRIQVGHCSDRAEIEAVVRAILKEQLGAAPKADAAFGPQAEPETGSLEANVAQMLENLDAFF